MEGAAAGTPHIFVAMAHEGTDGGWRSVKGVDAMPIDHLPDPGGRRVRRHTLEQQGCCAICERSIDHIAVPGDPANIGSTPVNLSVAIIENATMCQRAE